MAAQAVIAPLPHVCVQVAAACRVAAAHYRLFLDSFRLPDGSWPADVGDEDAGHYVGAAFSLPRMLQGAAAACEQRGCGVRTKQRMEDAYGAGGISASLPWHTLRPPLHPHRQQVDALEEAAGWIDRAVMYVNAHKLSAWNDQAALAQEMAMLLREKCSLLRPRV